MKVLVTANQKGGVGKTTTVVHLAFDFLERGLRVVVIDLDTQGNASYSLNNFASGTPASAFFTNSIISIDAEKSLTLFSADAKLANLDKMGLQEAGSAFRKSIDQLRGKVDVVLVDTAPSLGISMAAALLAADHVLSPIELEVFSLQGIKQMLTTIANLRQANKKLKFLGMVPSRVDSRNPRHRRHLKEIRKSYPNHVLPVSIGLRSSIADALSQGVPVWQVKKTAARAAAKEVRELANIVFKKMEL